MRLPLIFILFLSCVKATSFNFINISDSMTVFVAYNVATINPDGSVIWGDMHVTPEIAYGQQYTIYLNIKNNQKIYTQWASVIQPDISWAWTYCDLESPRCISECYMDNQHTSTSYLPVYHYKDWPPIIIREVICKK